MFPTHSTKFLLIDDEDQVIDGIFLQVLRSSSGHGKMAYVNENVNKYESFSFQLNGDKIVTSHNSKVSIRILRDDDGSVMVFQMQNIQTGKSWYFLRENAAFDQEITESVPEYEMQIALIEC
jgi:hypothetical protein